MTSIAASAESAQEKVARDMFNGLWERHHEAVYAYCYRFFFDEHRASDVTQRVFLDAYRALLDNRFDGVFERAWLMQNCLRKCQDDKRYGWGRYVRGSLERLFGDFITGEHFDPSTQRGSTTSPSLIRTGQEALTDENADPALTLQRSVVVAQVQGVLSLLSPMDRATLLAHEQDGQSCQELADAFGTTRQAIKHRLFRGRERFRQAWIGRYGPYQQEMVA